MDSAEIRERFLEFFEEHGHTLVASAPLVPDDPTLLFTNAGMVQFKDVFLGLESRAYDRATTAQKCMRVSGKHNDLENVGPSPRHHTFFEMLGNFSFGDYFKLGAIRLGWSFMTEAMGIDPGRLYLTVHKDDEEAYGIWVDDIGVAPDRVLRMGDKTNFWMMADTGPCGPTSEIHYDFGPERCTCGRPDCSVALDNDCGRWLELWNLVFMQYDQTAGGARLPLPKTGVDTGMGLDRLVTVKQGVASTYDTDLFRPILGRVQALLGHGDDERRAHETAYRVVADHGRAMTFLIADGVLPGNDGRNYVLRLIMRRAMRFGRLAGFDGPFLAEIAGAVIDKMGGVYPELARKADWIREVVTIEEARFARTLESGLAILDDVVEQVQIAGGARIAGEDVFRLYDTYGFPPDLTRVVAEEHGLGIDMAGFEKAMAAQRERARAAGQFGAGGSEETYRRLGLDDVAFLGYDTNEAEGKVVMLIVDGRPSVRAVAGTVVEVVLDRTPFYAESGGQVGDTGVLAGPDGRVRVTDTRRPVPGVTAHYGVVEEGALSPGDVVTATVDAERRLDVMRNHTATHLLHRALQEVLGEHAQQRGSLVAPDRLRFDFAHLAALSEAEIEQVEARVNAMVRGDLAVGWSLMPLEEAHRQGAMMLFGEKYGDFVRMIDIGDGVSRELCGGTHLGRTGQIGMFVVTGESSVGAGIRRLEAQTGAGAERFVRERLRQLRALAGQLGTPAVEGIGPRLAEVLDRSRDLARELAAARAELAAARAGSLSGRRVEVDGVTLLAARVEAADAEALRGQVDALRGEVPSGVIVLGAVIDGRPRVVAAVTEDHVRAGLHAGQLVKAIAADIGGGGGGRPHLAEAGGQDAAALDAALAKVEERLRVARSGRNGDS